MKKALDYNITVYSIQIEVNSKPIDHIQLVVSYIVLKDEVYLCLRNVLYPSVLDEFLKDFEENALGVFISWFWLVDNKAANDFILYDIEQEVKLISLTQKLKGNH